MFRHSAGTPWMPGCKVAVLVPHNHVYPDQVPGAPLQLATAVQVLTFPRRLQLPGSNIKIAG